MLTLLFAITFDGHAVETFDNDEAAIQKAVRAAQEGNKHAAQQLYHHFVSGVYRALRPLCANDTDAEDVTQDAFIRAFEALHRYEPQANKRFASWLMTVALNVARKQHRRQSKRQKFSALEKSMDHNAESTIQMEGEKNPQEQVELVELREALLKALGTLSERDRHVVTLRYGADLNATEVAEACKLSPAAVRKICERQKRHLLDQLKAASISLASEQSP